MMTNHFPKMAAHTTQQTLASGHTPLDPNHDRTVLARLGRTATVNLDVLGRMLHHAATVNIPGNSNRLTDKLKSGSVRAEIPSHIN